MKFRLPTSVFICFAEQASGRFQAIKPENWFPSLSSLVNKIISVKGYMTHRMRVDRQSQWLYASRVYHHQNFASSSKSRGNLHKSRISNTELWEFFEQLITRLYCTVGIFSVDRDLNKWKSTPHRPPLSIARNFLKGTRTRLERPPIQKGKSNRINRRPIAF